MAIDTSDRRASVLGLGLAFRLVLPTPGTIDQPDRQHVAYCYRGIEVGTPIIITGDEVTTAIAYFTRAVSGENAAFGRRVTAADAER